MPTSTPIQGDICTHAEFVMNGRKIAQKWCEAWGFHKYEISLRLHQHGRRKLLYYIDTLVESVAPTWGEKDTLVESVALTWEEKDTLVESVALTWEEKDTLVESVAPTWGEKDTLL